MSLTARFLEENGISTIIIGSARDIVENCAVPRFLFTDFPLGNPIGRPFDRKMQKTVIRESLSLLESAQRSKTTSASSLSWGEDQSWRKNNMDFSTNDLARLRTMGEVRRNTRNSLKIRKP